MKKTIILAAATLLVTGTGAFAQAAMSPAPGAATTKSTTPEAGMKSDTSADAAAKPKARHHRMARNEAALNAQEAETTKQLNQEQAQMASNNKGMSSPSAPRMDSNAASSREANPDNPSP